MLQKLRSLGLSTKIIATTLIVVTVVVAANYAVFMSGYREAAKEALVDEAKYFTSLANETKNHVAELHERGAFDTAALLEDLKRQRESSPSFDYTQARIFPTIPVVAGWQAGGAAAEAEGLDFRTPAFDARNPKNDPKNDPDPQMARFRTRLLSDLSAQLAAGQGDQIYAVNEEANTLHYMRAIQLDASCMTCHGAPGDPKHDPDGDGLDPLGFPMEGWAVGDQHGAFEVIFPLEPMDAQVAGFFSRGLMFTIPLMIVAAGGFILLLRGLLTRPVNNLVEMVKDVATGEGDLTKRLDLRRKDEIGQLAHWFDVFMDKLQALIKEVAGVTNEVASAATQIAASNEEMAQGMQQQQSQTGQVSAAVEEMSVSITEVAQKASDAARKSVEAGEQATRGGGVVEQTIEGMNAISEQVNESAVAVGELGKRGEQIGEVISVINDIADQTNLLALNAAIEAARAGEHGRGFAVVADEVRKLAERTQKATEEVAESIRAIQGETSHAVERMQSGREQVGAGVTLAQEAGASLTEIVTASRSVAEMIQSIAAAAEQQSAASTEVSRSVESINAVTNESAEGVRQASEAAAQLSGKAEQLRALVNRFRLD